MKDHETFVPESTNDNNKVDHFPKLMSTFCMLVAFGFFITGLLIG